MRTTVTLDADVDAMLKRFMAERKLTFKEAINTAIRRGLADDRPRTTFPTFHMGEASIDIDQALEIAGALEDEEIMRELERRK
ncbi:MAG TPA: antitoxin [Acidimicrobiia bacterium]|jgi:hypothetical protein|nr:antitoxin [Acidimicrobiia bacterium]